jgi:hypothetical protein
MLITRMFPPFAAPVRSLTGGYPCCCGSLGSTSSQQPGSTQSGSLSSQIFLTGHACVRCTAQTTPRRYAVDIAGIGDRGLCGDWEQLNASYVVAQKPAQPCDYEIIFPTACWANRLSLVLGSVLVSGTERLTLRVRLLRDPGAGSGVWSQTYWEKILDPVETDCRITNETLPLVDPGQFPPFDPSGATATVTFLND